MRFYGGLSPSELAALDPEDRFRLRVEMQRISAQERLQQILDLGALLSNQEQHKEYITKLGEIAFKFDEEALSRFYSAVLRVSR